MNNEITKSTNTPALASMIDDILTIYTFSYNTLTFLVPKGV